MAEELHVLFGGPLPDTAALGRAMKDLKFPFSIAPPAISLDQHSGLLPMRLRREETGVELSIFNGRDVVEELAEQDVDPGFDRVASFRWSSDESEMLAGLCAAAALAKLVNGIVLEEWDGQLLQPAEAVAVARQHVKAVKLPGREPGTRPADIKRYLSPLLKLRGDLVLVGRMLLVRPVRHLLRGAFLDRTSDKYSFCPRPYIHPLGDPAGSVGYVDPLLGAHWQVWQPHFEALLFDTLAEDIFGHVGTMTTLADFAGELSGTDRFHTARVHALVLSGQRDEAVNYIRDREERNWTVWAKEQWALLTRDIDEVCAEFHAKETETVKAMKLEEIWEPSPFPVELPIAQRDKSAESYFSTTPWVSRPPWLLQDVPQHSGDICYAKDRLFRDGETILLVPLTREEAEERHREYEPYVLAARTAGGLLVLLRRDGTDRNDPWRIKHPGRHSRDYIIFELHGSDRAAKALLFQDDQVDGFFQLKFLDMLNRRRRTSFWSCNIDLEDSLVRIHDNRKRGDTIFTKRELSETERAIISFPIPAFGDFEELSARTLALLRSAGYGDLT